MALVTLTTSATATAERRPAIQRFRWVHGPALDLAMATSWVPFAALGWLWAGDGARLTGLFAITLLISFAHQPLTVALVYGDRRNFDLRRRIFTWSPLVLAVAVLATRHVSPATLAVVAGLWNAEHTLMQRYGITRIYGRKVGQQEGALEKVLLGSWLVLALVWVAADARTPARAERTGIGGTNGRGLEILTALRPGARTVLPLVAVAAVVLTVWWVRTEIQRGARANLAKHVYVGSTAALFLVILVHPIAGLLGYVGSHAVEYFVIVHQSLGPRYADADADGGAPLGHAVRRVGRLGFFALYLGAVVALVVALDRYGDATAYVLVVFTLGGLHIFYDGFIWKRPAPGRGGMLT
jgi:hypothetical protein